MASKVVKFAQHIFAECIQWNVMGKSKFVDHATKRNISAILTLNQRESFSNALRMTINNQGNTKVKWAVAKERL